VKTCGTAAVVVLVAFAVLLVDACHPLLHVGTFCCARSVHLRPRIARTVLLEKSLCRRSGSLLLPCRVPLLQMLAPAWHKRSVSGGLEVLLLLSCSQANFQGQYLSLCRPRA
jgi:hypothetical protein